MFDKCMILLPQKLYLEENSIGTYLLSLLDYKPSSISNNIY